MEALKTDVFLKQLLLKELMEFYGTLEPSIKTNFKTWAKRIEKLSDYRSAYSLKNSFRRYWTIHISYDMIEPMINAFEMAENFYKHFESKIYLNLIVFLFLS